MNIRHDLTKQEVAEQTERKIQQLLSDKTYAVKTSIENCARYAAHVKDGNAEKYWVRRPETPEWNSEFYDGLISTEREHYAKVRIIELVQSNKPKKFILVYGNADDMTVENGTGPFESIEVAKSWYLSGGR